MKLLRMTIVGVVSVLVMGAVSPAAASAIALDFVASSASANAFLADSSRLAETHGASRRILAFARREEPSRARIVAAFADAAASERRAARAADSGPSLDMLGRLFGPTDRAISVFVSQGRPVLPDLALLRGGDFDALYVTSQTDALQRLVAFYVDFIKNGDDQTLRRLAVEDLPRARQLLAQIPRL